MANPDWFDIEPLDRESDAMFTFILEMCQDIKGWSFNKILIEGRKPGPTPREVRREEWLNEYLRLVPHAEDVPRHALRMALEIVLDYGKKKDPEKSTAWKKFAVEPRKGWKKAEDKDTIVSWEDWLKGKEATAYQQRVTKEKTAKQLFVYGVIAFRWGRLSFGKTSLKRLKKMAEANDWDEEEFVYKIKQINFRRWREKWQVNFDFIG